MRYAFADCVLDTELHELRRTGVPVKLQRKVYQVLAYLVEQRARLVTKEELLDHLWPGVYVEDYAEELQTLHRRLARVREGQGQVVRIVGEPGMGKTRLLAEFQQSLAGKSAMYLAGRCQAYGTATSYLPLGRLVRQL